MNEKHINKNSISCKGHSTKSPLPQHDGRLVVGIIPQGYKQTSIGIIPQDWEVVRLGEVGDIVGGGTPDTTNPAFWNGEILWLTPTEIKQKYISTSERKITQKGLENSSAKILPKNTILITTRATIGDIGIATKQLCTNQGFQSFVSGKNANFEFMYYLLCTKRSQFISLANGSTFLEVSAKTIRQIQIPLPPLKEQEKIARILGVWDSALDTLANLIKAKRKYKTALMQRLLTPPKDKSTHPLAPSAREGEQEKAPPLAGGVWGGVSTINKWECVESPRTNEGESQSSLRFAGFSDKWQEFRLGDIGEIVTGTTPSTKQKEFYENGIYPWITPTDIGEQREIYTSARYLSAMGIKQGRFIPKGSLLVTCIASIGKNAILMKDGSCNQQINAILPSNKHDINFLYYLMEYKSEYLISFSGKSATHILNKTNFSNLTFFIPTLAEQKKIAQVLSACDKEIETLNLKFECLKAQKRGLMQQLLSGKVRVKC